MTAFAFDHIHLRSPDPDATAPHYVALFDAAPRGRVEEDGRLRVTVELAGVLLFIDRVPAGTAGPPEPPHAGLEHIGLRVERIDEMIAELRRRGADVEREPHDVRPGLRIALVRGPEGVRVELLQRG